MTGRLSDPDRKRKLYAVVAIAVVLVMLLMTVVLPDEQGQLRTDLQVGDYYVLADTRNSIQYTYKITAIDGDTLTVSVTSQHSSETDEMSKAEFLSQIYASDELLKDGEEIAIAVVDTPIGNALCHAYRIHLSTYLVDEHHIIYYSMKGGLPTKLVDCSLIKKAPWASTHTESVIEGWVLSQEEGS
jgi:hypothetical protein